MHCACTIQAASIHGVASLTVQNSSMVKQAKSLNFGTFNINDSSTFQVTHDSTLTISPNGILTMIGGSMSYNLAKSGNVISPAVLSVANSTPFTDLTLAVYPNSDIVHIDEVTNNGKFQINRFVVINPENGQHEYESGAVIKTDKTGNLDLALGASLTMQGDKAYRDGLYTGSYSIELHY